MTLWLSIIGMGLITYAIRLSVIVALRSTDLPGLFRRGLAYVPPAVLSAIIFPELLQPGGNLDISTGNARLLAGLVACVIAWRTSNVLLTIGVGMVALWLIQILV
jgi:branched-subunit amino acid transport protein